MSLGVPWEMSACCSGPPLLCLTTEMDTEVTFSFSSLPYGIYALGKPMYILPPPHPISQMFPQHCFLVSRTTCMQLPSSIYSQHNYSLVSKLCWYPFFFEQHSVNCHTDEHCSMLWYERTLGSSFIVFKLNGNCKVHWTAYGTGPYKNNTLLLSLLCTANQK